jgi:hypothetical protein
MSLHIPFIALLKHKTELKNKCSDQIALLLIHKAKLLLITKIAARKESESFWSSSELKICSFQDSFYVAVGVGRVRQ